MSAAVLPAIGTRVRVHKNLQRGDWSVTVRGVVVANVDAITLADVRPVYWTGGLARVRAAADAGRPRRRVCAWLEGAICETPQGLPAREITFNPYRADAFHTRDGSPVARADYVAFGAVAVALGALS